MFWTNLRQKLLAIPSKFRFSVGGNTRSRFILTAFGIVVILVLLIGFYWSREPAPFSVAGTTNQRLARIGDEYVVGSATTAALISAAETLLDKPGGYLSNDMLPPGIYLDNIPNWEFGVLVQIRDLSRSMRESFSRSQSQSTEDVDLIISEPRFHFDNDSWLFPPTESEYREAIGYLNSYLSRISDPQNSDAQFFARADNLASWLQNVESRLGSLSQRLSASVQQQRVNIARGFAYPYPALLLDEPTASLDPVNRATVLKMIAEAKARGAAIIGIFHDHAARDEICDRQFDVTRFTPGLAA